MSKRMTIALDLSATWEHTVGAGKIRNQFKGANGNRIESGVRMAAGGPQHYAIDLETGHEIAAAVLERPIGPSGFVLLLNEFRSLKPRAPMLGLGRQRDYSAEVSDCFFACQDPSNPLSILRRHAPLRTALPNLQWAALPNALPVEKGGHFLWMPVLTDGAITTFPHSPQVLTFPVLEDLLVLAASGTNLLTFYNSMHAGASVNHMHFHTVHRGQQMAIEKASILSLGGRHFLDDYPASGLIFLEDAPAESIWHDVDRLQQCGVPLNLLSTGSRTYLIPRNIDREVVEEFPAGILAGMELAGRPITTEQSFYDSADWTTLHTALQKSTLRNEDVLRILEA
jgi:hypothetical protein